MSAGDCPACLHNQCGMCGREIQPPPTAAPNDLLRLFDLYATNLLQGANGQAAVTRDTFRRLLGLSA